MVVSEDGLMLINSAQPAAGLYDISQIKTIYLDFEQPNWWQQLTNNYYSRADIPATLTYEGETYEAVGVHFRGFTSYMNIRNSQKKSFNISLDFENTDQRLLGYKTLNLNNCYEDPSFMREALYSHLAGMNTPLFKVNFVKLVINGENWGIYSNVQQLNRDFYNEWFTENKGANWRAEMTGGFGFTFGEGYCSLNYLGMDSTSYKKYYNLKSSKIEHPWEKLVDGCVYLNLSPTEDLYDSLQHYLDVDRSLWHIANEIAFTDEDGYVNKGGSDYFVYYDKATDRITPIDYDANSTFLIKEVNLSPYHRENNSKYPLINKLFSNPELKQRYTAHLRTIIKNCFDEEYTNSVIDRFADLIASEVKLDTKKLYTDNQFEKSVAELKTFIKNRKSFLLKNEIISATPPEISQVKYISENGENSPPSPNSNVTVQANVSCDEGVKEVILYWGLGLAGSFSRVTMQSQTSGVYAAEIPAQAPYTYVRFYVEARADNKYISSSFNPEGAEHDLYFYQVKAQKIDNFPVVINEFMADNKTTIQDPQGEYDDWIELFNKGTESVDLSGMYLSDKLDNPKKWKFPENTSIAAGEYLLIWADENSKANPGIHTNFKLSAQGEVILFSARDGEGNALLDSISFGPQEKDISCGRYPNGEGAFYQMSPTPLAYNSPPIGYVNDLSKEISDFNIFPNPFTNKVSFNLNVLNSANYEISVFDARGFEITKLYKDRLHIGQHSFSWNGLDQFGNEISAGTYFIRLLSNGNAMIVPIIKI